MTNPLLKAAGITPDTPGHSAERALFEAASRCTERLRETRIPLRYGTIKACCFTLYVDPHTDRCPLAAFDEAVKNFQEAV
jgi:hypothetical protein